MKKISTKIIVVLGPTASGKSDLAVSLAKKFNGEVVSADSRQVYKGLDIGTGKITKKEMRGVPHHLLDVVSPKKTFTVTQFKSQAGKAIEEIAKRGRMPIVCGGTGFYIQALVDDILFPDVPPDPDLRKSLSKKNNAELFSMLQKIDPDRAAAIDPKNPVRLIRAIEIAKTLGKVPHLKTSEKYDAFIIGIETEDSELKDRIYKRLISRIKKGMIREAENLHKKGLSWRRMEELGLEYRYLALFLQNKISKQEMVDELATKIWQYAKRQRTWFKRDPRIKWFKLGDTGSIEKIIQGFL